MSVSDRGTGRQKEDSKTGHLVPGRLLDVKPHVSRRVSAPPDVLIDTVKHMRVSPGVSPGVSQGVSPVDREAMAAAATAARRKSGPQPLLRRKRFSMHSVAMNIRQYVHVVRTFQSCFREKKQQVAPRIAYANTYRTEPKPSERFRPDLARDVTLRILEETVSDMPYVAQTCGMVSCRLSEQIKDAIKGLFPRHKIVCQVSVGQQQRQDVVSVSRCLWDAESDKMAHVTYSNGSVFVSAVIYAVYFE